MDITINGVHMDLGAALQDHTQKKIADIQHYFDQVQAVDVFFKDTSHGKCEADLTVHASGIVLRAEAEGAESYSALDAAFAKIVVQLKKYKGRLGKHRERRQKYEEKFSGMASLAMEDAHVEEDALDGVPHNLFEDYAPQVVRKDVSEIAPMSVDEAVMQMDLLHKPAYLFLNARTGTLNMVYREKGNIVRWISPAKRAS